MTLIIILSIFISFYIDILIFIKIYQDIIYNNEIH